MGINGRSETLFDQRARFNVVGNHGTQTMFTEPSEFMSIQNSSGDLERKQVVRFQQQLKALAFCRSHMLKPKKDPAN